MIQVGMKVTIDPEMLPTSNNWRRWFLDLVRDQDVMVVQGFSRASGMRKARLSMHGWRDSMVFCSLDPNWLREIT